jgi:hypothetical protein
VIKKTVREIETGEGVLIFDDTLQEKPHSAVKTSLNGVMPWQIAGFLPNGNIIRVRNISF